ncbi:SA1362 family protein [Bacillus sp. PS06]|uniref:SA1362 family protein n=1 Tax=Bacillus sp. PS06 TaxID=2764176 RepID=UPI001784638B|nr:SA1362 family protein [Bacillus sp. PS06]MBD8070415.1 hypothetical protein [Bacillus sp. PS06]
MNRRRMDLVVYSIIILGIVGILYILFTDPSRLLMQLGSIVLFAGIIFLVYKFVMKRRTGGNEYSAYLRAAKRSKRRFNEQSHKKPISKVVDAKKLSSSTKKSTQSRKGPTPHLTVIEGKKGKKKNRAFF